jgi:hypothetical protein
MESASEKQAPLGQGGSAGGSGNQGAAQPPQAWGKAAMTVEAQRKVEPLRKVEAQRKVETPRKAAARAKAARARRRGGVPLRLGPTRVARPGLEGVEVPASTWDRPFVAG